jgi:hypothetical protein
VNAAGVPSVLATFWTGILAVLLAVAVITAAALLNTDRIRAWLAAPPIDLDAQDMPRQTWAPLTEAEARAVHPAGRDLPGKAGKELCESCFVWHPEHEIEPEVHGVTPVGGFLESWVCPTCGWRNVVPAAPVRPVRGEL